MFENVISNISVILSWGNKSVILTHWPLGYFNQILDNWFFKLILLIYGSEISCEINLRLLSLDLTGDKSTLVQASPDHNELSVTLSCSDIIYTGRSFDIMSHEAGHAILDSLKPHYITSKNPQCGALHESFGDLTAIFALLESLDMCEAIIAYSKVGDMGPASI